MCSCGRMLALFESTHITSTFACARSPPKAKFDRPAGEDSGASPIWLGQEAPAKCSGSVTKILRAPESFAHARGCGGPRRLAVRLPPFQPGPAKVGARVGRAYAPLAAVFASDQSEPPSASGEAMRDLNEPLPRLDCRPPAGSATIAGTSSCRSFPKGAKAHLSKLLRLATSRRHDNTGQIERE